ncbi:glycosyltransferase family 2 protein [Serinibacter salmoneus]|nr:glycosyltransferase family A protein [Serinibacter salmoneus]
MRDVLALATTRGGMAFDELSDVLESVGTSTTVEETLGMLHLHAGSACGLAQTLYAQRLDPEDIDRATTLYSLVEAQWSTQKLTGHDRSLYGDGLVRRGEYERGVAMLRTRYPDRRREVSQLFLRENGRNPYLTDGHPVTDQAWLSEVNRLLATEGLVPIGLRPGPEHPFLRLTATSTPTPVVDGPLVSILMPVYEPDDATDLAIASILAQSWRNIELIIVDDGSPEVDEDGAPTSYRAQLQRWADRDARIRLTFNTPNRGAYTVRNMAYAQAAGEFVTVADKDDWHHPQHIETQARHLMSSGDVANISMWVRCDNDMRFLVKTAPDQVVHVSFPSMMFRRETVMSRLGYWDAVRKGADTEYKRRLELLFNDDERLKPVTRSPLQVSLMGDNNLTSQDNSLGYFSEARLQYRATYRAWHRAVADGSADSYMPMNPDRSRIIAPAGFLPSRTQEPYRCDVVVIADFSRGSRDIDRFARALVGELVDRGLRIGIIPMRSFLRRPEEDSTPDIDALVESGKVRRLSLSSGIPADVVFVAEASLMQLRRDDGVPFEADHVVVHADRFAVRRDEGRANYEVATVARNVKAIFGHHPQWLARTPRIQSWLTSSKVGAATPTCVEEMGVIALVDYLDSCRDHSGTRENAEILA